MRLSGPKSNTSTKPRRSNDSNLTRSVSSKPKYKKPSGYQNRKRKREERQAAIVAAGVTELIPKIGKLETASDWLTEIADVYRRARCGALEKSEATKLGWLCAEAAKLSRSIEELAELQQLRAQLQALNGGTMPQVTRTYADEAIDQ